jgi:hypothetical protein
MNSAPFRRFPRSFGDGKLLPGVRGGNLARVTCNALSTRTGHFLFVSKQLKKLLRQITNAGGVSSFSPTSAGAASNRRALMSAKSRPHVIQVDHVAHVVLLPSFTVLGGHSELRERCSLP